MLEMKHNRPLGLLLLLVCTSIGSSVKGATSSPIIRNADLKRQMYDEPLNPTACIRLLNATGVVGCAGSAIAPLELLEDPLQDLSGERVVVVPADQADSFLLQVLHDPSLQSSVKGVLIAAGRPPASSQADAFPQAAFAPYAAKSYAWNPNGSGVSGHAFGFPIMLLDNATSARALERANANAAKDFKGALHVGELQAVMAASGSSGSCLAGRSCAPLGSHSVWAAMPPLPLNAGPFSRGASGAGDGKPVTLVLAAVDSTALFHDAIVGADAPLSGLIAMLAAVDALSRAGATGRYGRRLAFAALAGEPWGYMGSKRLLWEMQQGRDTVAGLHLRDIDQVIEIGQVGRAASADGSAARFYVHSQRGGGFGNASQLASALQTAGRKVTSLQAIVAEASASNPGIPPSSLMSFLRVNASIAGAVLAEFDSEYINPYYGSHLDTAEGVSSAGIAAAAVVAARALHRLALNDSEAPPLLVNETHTRELVDELLGCLVHGVPNLACPLARSLMSATGPAEHYIGVLRTLTQNSQDPDPNVKGNAARFLWNFLAEHTAAGPASLAGAGAFAADAGSGGCMAGSHPCEPGAVCVGQHGSGAGPDGGGRCMWATARYLPSYSTHLTCQDCAGDPWDDTWSVTNDSAEWEAAGQWPPDPMWVESDWPGLRLVLYQREDPVADRAMLISGSVLTAAAAVFIWALWS